MNTEAGDLTGPSVPGDDVQLRPIDTRVRRQWRIEWMLASVLIGVVLAIIAAALPFNAAGQVGIALLAFAATIAVGLALVQVRYRYWRYGLADDVLVLEYGVWIRRRSMTPYYRVQNVDLVAGPLERWLGLQRLTIKTASASTDATIPGLDATDAELLRGRILERAGRDGAV